MSPPQADGMVRCSMLVCDLTDPNTTYIALSYMWGTDQPTHQILIDEHPFMIRSNLAHFLMRSQHWKLDPIFIDALCINQDDISERNQQVRLMGQIYANAQRVISWLGHGNERVDGAIPFIKQFLPLSTGSLQKFYKGKESSIREAQQAWNLVHLFTDLQYWTRIWMVQEISNARAITYVYGDHSIDGGDLFQFSQELRDTYPCPAPLPDLLFRSRCFSYLEVGNRLPFYSAGSSMQAKLIDVLWDYGLSVCGEKRDRVYALLSLAKEGPQFPVDYETSLTELFSQVWQFRPETGIHFMAFTKHMIQALLDSPQDIDEIKDCTRPKHYRFQLYPVHCSWAPTIFHYSTFTSIYEFSFGNADKVIEYQPACDGPIRSLRLRAWPFSRFNHPRIFIEVKIDMDQIKNQAFEPNDMIFDVENSGLLIIGRYDVHDELQIVAQLSLSAGLSHDDGKVEVTARWYPWSSMLDKMRTKHQAYSIEMVEGTPYLCCNEMALRVFTTGLHYERNFIQVHTNPPDHAQNPDHQLSTYEIDLLSVHWYMPTGQHSLTEVAMLRNVYQWYFQDTHPKPSPPQKLSTSRAIHSLTRSRIDLYGYDDDKDEDKPLPWRDLLERETDTTRVPNLFY